MYVRSSGPHYFIMLLMNMTGACDHEPLTSPPTDPDGKLLEYFDR